MKQVYYPLLMLIMQLYLVSPLYAGVLSHSYDTIPVATFANVETEPIVPLAYNTGDWSFLGAANTAASPYSLYCYKLLQVNTANYRYASIIELSVQGDANGYAQQGTYRIRADKYENTNGRFDGLEVQCISGNPEAATFYVYNDALWVRSNYQWGNLYYRTIADFSNNSPLTGSPFGQTTTVPTGFVTSTSSYGLKCNFDANVYYKLPYTDVTGKMMVNSMLGVGTANPQFTLHTVANNNTGSPSSLLWGQHYGVAVGIASTSSTHYALSVRANLNADGSAGTGGTNSLLLVRADGNVGIGTTTPQAKLAVNGDIFATRVKVTQQGWADFVFQPDYQLPSLYEIEKYITANRHLPDIPTTAEVEQEGLDLGEMDKKLLQKIEELTLYIIQLNKKNEALEQRVAELEQQPCIR